MEKGELKKSLRTCHIMRKRGWKFGYVEDLGYMWIDPQTGKAFSRDEAVNIQKGRDLERKREEARINEYMRYHGINKELDLIHMGGKGV